MFVNNGISILGALGKQTRWVLGSGVKKAYSGLCINRNNARLYHSTVASLSTTQIPLTKDRYAYLSRKDFKKIEDSDVSAFKSILSAADVVTDEHDMGMYLSDWTRTYRGQGSLVLKPKSTAQVSEIMKYCNQHNIAVVPQGGNTGLVGGGVPVFDEVVVSLSKMNKIGNFDDVSGILECDAGCVLETLDKYLQERGYIMPIDLGAKGSCHIGGNVATNAGGIHFLRYGSLHGSVLGVEAVLADGSIVNTISSCRKDNTGYDLKQLFIGSEGTLGIVTRISILCPPASKSKCVAFLGCEKFEHVLEALKISKSKLGETLSAYEFLDDKSMQSALNVAGNKNPLQERYPFYILVECSGSNEEHDSAKMMDFLDYCMSEAEIIVDGTASQDLTQYHNIWKIRESITEGLLHDGYGIYKYDISLPLSKYYEAVTAVRARLDASVKDRYTRCCGYGHVGDGNLHLNITSKEFDADVKGQIEPFIYEFTKENNGSVSAEHGLGLMKANCIHYSKSSSSIKLMQNIKKMMDPKGILNPYKTVV